MPVIKVMIAGASGKIANLLANRILDGKHGKDILLVNAGLAENPGVWKVVANGVCIPPCDHKAAIMAQKPDIIVDFTQPLAVIPNAKLYRDCGVPFVMGTTGGERDLLADIVTGSKISAVIAPNMAKQVVALMAMFRFAAEKFPGVFAGYRMMVKESHQQTKKDTSGTALAIIRHFNALGIPFAKDQIIMIRDPMAQETMGVPKKHLAGHGWHTYTLMSPDGDALFRFTHNICGREVYVAGAIDAIRFLYANRACKGKVFTMEDVIGASPIH
jgi:4-hydroxy-tetrahydrodipicolinate reductase